MHVRKVKWQKKIEVQFFVHRIELLFLVKLLYTHAYGRGFLSRDTCVAQECMIRYVVYRVLPRNVDILSECESLGRVPRDVVVSHKTELMSALLSA